MKSITGVILLIAAVAMVSQALDAAAYMESSAVGALAADGVYDSMLQLAQLRFLSFLVGAGVCALFGGVLLVS